MKRDALITCVWTNDKYVNELNKPTLVNAKKSNKGKLFRIISLDLIISWKVKGSNITHTKSHLKKTKDIGGIFVINANFPITKLPAQNNVAQINITYAFVFCIY